jgi:multicomponent Na+:H+ antiporter subunit G
MALVLEITAIIVILIGTAFSIIGVIGFIRLPDVYTRLHATGKVGVYGVVMLLVAAVLQTPLAWGKALILIILLLVSGPVAAHAIASAATRIGLPMHDPVVDELHLEEFNREINSESHNLAYNKDMD